MVPITGRLLIWMSIVNSLAVNGLSQSGTAIFTYTNGPNFCQTGYGYTVPAFCTAPGELPLGSFPVPGIGSFYIDPNFGAKVRLLTDGTTNSIHQYSTPTAFSATGKYAVLGKLDGHTRIVEVATGNIIVPDLIPTLDVWSGFWSALDDDVIYSVGPAAHRTQIIKYQVSTGTKTVLVDYATDGHNFTNITMGGTGDISADNWTAFLVPDQHQVCAFDFNQVKTYCADYTAPNPNSHVGWNFIDYVLITKGKDVDTNKRYVLAMATPAMGAFSVNEQSGKLDFEFRGPETPAGLMGGDVPGVGNKDGICDPGESCVANPHADVFQDNGRQYLLLEVGVEGSVCEDQLSSLQISKGTNMLAPVASGGGRTFLFTLFKCGLTWSDIHLGCAKSTNAFCAISMEAQEPNLPNQIRDGRTPFDSEVMVMRGNGTEVRRLAMHRSVQTQYWDQPRACISPDGSKVMWDSNFGNPSNHRVVVAETGFGVSTGPVCTYTLSPASVAVGAAGGSGTISITASPNTCGPPSIISNVAWASASGSANTLNWSVTANSGAQNRVGSLSVSGQTVVVSQAGVMPNVSMMLFPSTLLVGTSGSLTTTPQSVSLTFSGGSGLSWTAASSQSNITVSPKSGVGNATLQVTFSPGPAGVVTVSAPGATNNPQVIQVQVTSATVAQPFGSLDTPLNNSKGVAAAVAVTGWALDSIGVTKVDIWRDPVGSERPGLVYIGDAVFVTGARPDVAKLYPTFPSANRAGWGYLLLTNFLPNVNGSRGSGNGMYTLHALAHNRAGLTAELGSVTITVDNASATLPFGSIDTPAQGETIWGNAYTNFGWALTPMPGIIPVDGTTITVNVDGLTIGHPTYNQFRGDIATYFTGFANSNGAIGFFYIDTTKLTNGLHSISWNVYDDKVRGNGVGSRFFNVLNVGNGTTADPAQTLPTGSSDLAAAPSEGDLSWAANRIFPVNDKEVSMQVEEMDRIEVPVGATDGYVVANDEREPLPIGSTLKDGVFYWQLAPVFLGEYNLVFENQGLPPKHVRVAVRPKAYSAGEVQAIQ